ncbi:MAG TPA: tRNA pseudouridine(55) synthase TruB [Oscillospiraceae bacterium]|nr:tRNA pseudouridine(55) synthase TruB [Oscillospiraceae bacterium]
MASGVLVVDKEAGWTSHDVVARLRGVLHERRIGHAGTLDPMATGVLPVLVGRATRAMEFLEHGEKTYEAALRLGVVTDTQDVTGTVLETHRTDVSPETLERALGAFRGDILQIPPMYSAVKIGGKKLYELARAGKEIERKPRPVTILRLVCTGRAENGDWLLTVTCSKGTYIRTLCHDIGAALGCGGALAALRRTAAAGFTLGDAVTLWDVEREGASLLRPVDVCFARYPSLTLDAARERLCRNGNAFSADAPDGRVRAYAPDGTFLMLGEVKNGRVTTVKSFFEV